VIVGAYYVQPVLLSHTESKYAFSALPLLVIAFGFHNMIPSLTAYLNGDLKRVRKTIIGGSVMAFVIYLIWEVLVLGIVPLNGPNGLYESLLHDQEASQAIAAIAGSPAISLFSQGLAFFAILTSFLAQALSLVHFLADGFKMSYRKHESVGLCALALLPPIVLSLIYPELFFKALNFAGGICAVVLFGILPVLMVWLGRYQKQTSMGYQVPGGRVALVGVLIVALFIFILQFSSMLGVHLLPAPLS
jgi:tyrosine-specific transport protein